MMQNYFQIELTAFHDIFFRFQRLYPSLSGYTRNELTFFSANDTADLVAMKESVLERVVFSVSIISFYFDYQEWHERNFVYTFILCNYHCKYFQWIEPLYYSMSSPIFYV